MKSILVFCAVISFLCIAGAHAGEKVIYSASFTGADSGCWSGWALVPQTINYVSNGCNDKPALKYTISSGNAWNTPIITFPKPIRVTDKTIVRFKLKCKQGKCGMNVRNFTEGNEYYIAVLSPATDKWFTVQKYLGEAVYKRGGNDDIPKDGLIGDEIASIQIASLGKEVWISGFEVVETSDPVKELPEEASLFEGKYELNNYEILGKFFPYGVVYQSVAEKVNAGLFNQGVYDRYEEAVNNIKRHYMNTFANFCDDADIDYRIDICNKYNIYRIETLFANTNLTAQANEDSKAVSTIKKAAEGDDKLLAWYGKDEPTNYKAWLDNKLVFNKYDKEHPVVSAFNEMSAVKALGPYSEVSCINIYSVTRASKDIQNLAYHADAIRTAKRLTAGKRVWFIAQTFDARGVLRYPDPEEIRFEVFNAISAGVDGLIFFLHNDACSYLEASRQREKFDYTLVDPWFNDNPTYRELARLGKEVVPVMPAILGAKEVADDQERMTYAREGLVFNRFANNSGTFLILANKSLDSSYYGKIRVSPRDDEQIYNLINLSPIKLVNGHTISVSLAAGDGAIYFIGKKNAWESIKSSILLRKIQAELDILKLDAANLRAAKLNTAPIENILSQVKTAINKGDLSAAEKGISLANIKRTAIEKSNPNYTRYKALLDSIRSNFGAMHSLIISKIKILDGTKDPNWLSLFDNMRQCSGEYFNIKNEWKHEDFSNIRQLMALDQKVKSLKKEIETAIAAMSAG
ncbi:MAG TPA: hypothetical protein DCL60_01450 [Armatimonadetes bacterium]|jgi:hypothetical protein|nr:hypothetical protein [Armatimonadota bacterium]